MNGVNPKDLLYSPMLTREKFGKDVAKSKRWILIASNAAIFYAGFNYYGGINKGNVIAGKVASSYLSLVGWFLIQCYQWWKESKDSALPKRL